MALGTGCEKRALIYQVSFLANGDVDNTPAMVLLFSGKLDTFQEMLWLLFSLSSKKGRP